MMPRKRTPSFITDLEIVANSKARKELNSRYNAGFRLANTIQSELLVRMELVRHSSEWQAAKKIPKTVGKGKKRKLNPERSEAFQAAKAKYRFTKQQAEQFAKYAAEQSVWIREKLDSVVIQAIAARIFKAVDKILYGKAKKVRFKNNNSFKSMEGKQITTSIRVAQDRKTSDYQFIWGKLKCPVIIDWADPCVKHGMESPWKYARIVRKRIRGKIRFFVQLICEGTPYSGRKNTQYKNADSSIDLNISTVAVVSEASAALLPFAPNAPDIDQKIKALDRQMERSSRANNPQNYHPDDTATKGKKGGRMIKRKGQIKRGIKLDWRHTQNYQKLRAQKQRLERSRSEYVRSANRALANRILREAGINVNMENVSVKAWQKLYGKAIKVKSPGFFQSELVRKAESAGGTVLQY